MLICQKPKIFDVDLIGLTVIAILALALWLGIEKTLSVRIRESDRDYLKLLQKEKKLQAELAQLEVLEREQSALAERLSQTPDVLGGNHGMPEVVRQLGNLASSHCLAIKELNPLTAEVCPYFMMHVVDIQCRGSYPDLYRFVESVEQEAPFSRIAAVSVRSSANDKSNRCDMVIKLHVFAAGERN